MPRFSHSFTVNATPQAVLSLHEDARALKRLTPPPIFVQLHRFEPLGEGSVAEFTMWFGPIPARWRAIHSDVSEQGFTDRQETGPLKQWQHRHRFVALEDGRVRIIDEVEFEHEAGLRGVATRLAFSRPALALLFAYRKWATRWTLQPAERRARTLRLAGFTAILAAIAVVAQQLRREGV